MAKRKQGKEEEILDLFAAGLGEIGFERSFRTAFTLRMSPEVLGAFGYSYTYRPGTYFSFTPVVGMIHLEVERLLSTLLGEADQDPRSSMTVSTPLSKLLSPGQFKAWRCPPDESVVGMVSDLKSELLSLGVPYMKRLSTLSAIASELETSTVEIRAMRDLRLPVCYLLLNDRQRALKYVEKVLEATGHEQTLIAKQYVEFASRLKRHLAIGKK